MNAFSRTVIAVVVAGMGYGLYLQHNQMLWLRSENARLKADVASLAQDKEALIGELENMRTSAPFKAYEFIETNVLVLALILVFVTGCVGHVLCRFLYWFFRITVKTGIGLYRFTKREVMPVTIDKLDAESTVAGLEGFSAAKPQQIATFVAESYVSGSEPTTSFVRPPFQCYIYGACEEGWKYAGVGIRDGATLIYPRHIQGQFGDGKTFQLRNCRNGSSDNARSFEVELKSNYSGDFDYARSLVDSSVFSALGIKNPNFSVAQVGTPLHVYCTDGDRQTSGLLRKHTDFGFVSYGGSTWNGFSGAAYYINNTVYGMHLGGGTVNLGYDSSMLCSLRRQEDSYDMLLSNLEAAARKGRKFRAYRRAVAGSGEAGEGYIEIGGRYHFLDVEDLDRFEDALVFDDVAFQVRAAEAARSEDQTLAFPDSGNVKRAVAFVAAPGPQEQKTNAQPSKKSKKNAQAQASVQLAAITAGPPSTLAQQNAALPFMSEDLRKLVVAELADRLAPRPSLEQRSDAVLGNANQ